MTDYKATPEQWANVQRFSAVAGESCILELRSRVQVLEDAAQKHIVETSSDIGALFRRIESLEAAERQASKVYEISKPLKLTAKQQQELNALLRPVTSQPTPNFSQIGSSLVERVAIAISRCEDSAAWDDEAVNWAPEARAAIREVAAWLREQKAVDLPDHTQWAAARAAAVLEQEAER
jgi:hypothetical protein